jgi:hypothetical protein
MLGLARLGLAQQCTSTISRALSTGACDLKATLAEMIPVEQVSTDSWHRHRQHAHASAAGVAVPPVCGVLKRQRLDCCARRASRLAE